MKNQLFVIALLCAAGSACAQHERTNVNLDSVAAQAKRLAEEPPQAPEALSDELKSMTYDQYREIRFRPSDALWWNADTLFRVEFFHPGQVLENQMDVYEVTETHAQRIPFLQDAFDYGKSGYNPGFFNAPDGYAGIRVKFPLNSREIHDELIVFQGSSYFRALGKGHHFGLSLRGISMNTLGDHEDFPRFTKLWLKKPEPGARQMTIFALLEGDKVTGAYQFDLRPNGITKIDVRARLFFRSGGAQEVGIAPMTSMFLHGENSHRPAVPDWRPEVHDSDGLLLHADNEWEWFPLENLPGRNAHRVPKAKLQGFGLIQRDRDFANYKDLEARYERRPSVWIQPKGKWPTGEIVLYTFGTKTEADDNVTAFWRPDLSGGDTKEFDFAYTISMQTKDPAHDLAKVLETRIGQRTLDPNAQTLMIEFSRPESIAIDEIEGLSLGFEAGGMELIGEPVIQHNEPEDRIRAFVNFRTPDGANGAGSYKMSAQLLQKGHQESERWHYTWKP